MSISRRRNYWTYRCFGTRHRPSSPDIYRGGRWFLQDQSAARATARRPYGDTMFLREFANRLTLGNEAPAYTLIHVFTPHLPLVTGADCTYAVPSTPDSERFANQARCALSSVRLLLDRLRDLDLYDRSAIIVTSDHGIEPTYIQPEEEHPLRGIETPARMTLPGVESRATPLLLVKPFASHGPLQTSYAPTAITDVPATLLDLAGLPNAPGRGASVLRIDPAEPRQRTYAHQDPKNPTGSFPQCPLRVRRRRKGRPIRTPGAIAGRYSSRRMIVRRNAGEPDRTVRRSERSSGRSWRPHLPD